MLIVVEIYIQKCKCNRNTEWWKMHKQYQWYPSHMVQTSYNLNGTRMFYCVRTQNACVCMSPHVATRASFYSNIIITNLWPLYINYMLPHSFCQPSEHSKWCIGFSDNSLTCVPRIKCLIIGKIQCGPKEIVLLSTKECLDHYLILTSVNKTNCKDILDCFINIYADTELADWWMLLST